MTIHRTSASSKGLFAVGASKYIDPRYSDPPHVEGTQNGLAAAIPRALRQIVDTLATVGYSTPQSETPGYLLNPAAYELMQELRRVGNMADVVIVYYTGHADDFGPDGYRLITSDFRLAELPDAGLKVSTLLDLLVRRNTDGTVNPIQPPTLVILDCCFAGVGAVEALRNSLFNMTHSNLWFCATARERDFAVVGHFAAAFSYSVANAPVGRSMEYIPAEVVVDGVNARLEEIGAEQRAEMFPPGGRYSRLVEFFPNPKFIPGVSGLTVSEQHWFSKVSGSSGSIADGGFYLTGRGGRIRAAESIADWIVRGNEGSLAIVTGSPGVGKSALLSLVALLSDRGSRKLLLQATKEQSFIHYSAGLIPVDSSVIAVHARGLNVDQIAKQIGIGLSRSTESVGLLLESLQKDPVTDPYTVIVDALDEATDARGVRDGLLALLSRASGVKLLLGTRRHELPADFAVDLLVDLDADEYKDPEALRDYVAELLTAAQEPAVISPYRNALGVVDSDTLTVALAVANKATARREVDGEGTESFLIARVIAMALRGRPRRVDLKSDEWERFLPGDLAAAFDEDLERLGERSATVRLLLEALSWAKGDGLPWEGLWTAVANVLSERGTVPTPAISDDDIAWMLDRAGSYIVEDLGPGGRSVFRPFHDLLAAHLRERRAVSVRQIEARITDALLSAVPSNSNDERQWDEAHPYIRTYLCEHAFAAGPEALDALLGEPGFPAAADPVTLTPLLLGAAGKRSVGAASYLRASPLLGDDITDNAVYLQEASLAVTGDLATFPSIDSSSNYRVLWTSLPAAGSRIVIGTRNQVVKSTVLISDSAGKLLLAVGDGDGSVTVWDAESGKIMREFRLGRASSVGAVAFAISSEGRYLLAAGGDDGRVMVWDAESGDKIGEFTGGRGMLAALRRFFSPNYWVRSVTMSSIADGRTLLATAGPGKQIRVWDVDTGEQILEKSTRGLTSSVTLGVDSGNRAILAVSGPDVGIWDPATGTLIREVPEVQGNSAIVLGSEKDSVTRLAAAEPNGMLRIVEWGHDADANSTSILNAGGHKVFSVALGSSGGGMLVVSGGIDGVVRGWDSKNGANAFVPLIGHSGSVASVSLGLSSGGRHLIASGGVDSTVRIWDVDTQDVEAQSARPLNRAPMASVAVGMLPNGEPLMATYQSGGPLRIWNAATRELIGDPVATSGGCLRSVALGVGSQGQALLGISGEDGTLRVLDVESRKVVGRPVRGLPRWASALAFGRGREGQGILAAGGRSLNVFVVDPERGRRLRRPLRHSSDDIRSLTFGFGVSERILLAARSSDGLMAAWDVDSGKDLFLPAQARRGVASVCLGFGPLDQVLVVTGSYDGVVRFWDADAGSLLAEVPAHRGVVRSMAFVTDLAGRLLLATGGDDGVLRIWDPNSMALVSELRRRGPIVSVGSAGSVLAVGDVDGTIVIQVRC